MNQNKVFFVLAFFLSTSSFGQMSDEEADFFRLSGIQPFLSQYQDGDYPNGKYIAPHDLIIEYGKVMTIQPGSIIYFKKDTRFFVKGKLVCLGSKASPVIFKKLENENYLTPITHSIETCWDGFYVSGSAEIEMSHTSICDSKYGIAAAKGVTALTLDSVLFKNNRQNFAYNNVVVNTQENTPFSYPFTVEEGPSAQLQRTELTLIDSTLSINTDDKTLQRPPEVKRVRVIFGVSALSGAAIAGAGLIINNKFYSRYDKARNPEFDNPTQVAKYKSIAKTGMRFSTAGSILCGIGLSGVLVTLLF
jgi:hypothetical protein